MEKILTSCQHVFFFPNMIQALRVGVCRWSCRRGRICRFESVFKFSPPPPSGSTVHAPWCLQCLEVKLRACISCLYLHHQLRSTSLSKQASILCLARTCPTGSRPTLCRYSDPSPPFRAREQVKAKPTFPPGFLECFFLLAFFAIPTNSLYGPT